VAVLIRFDCIIKRLLFTTALLNTKSWTRYTETTYVWRFKYKRDCY